MPDTLQAATGPGRPSLGTRDTFAVKLTPERGAKVRELKKLQVGSYQEILESAVNSFLDQIDLADYSRTEALPIAKAG